MRKSIIWSGLFLLAFTVQFAAQTRAKVFRGNVADKNVTLTLERDGNNLSGTYFYQKIGKNLNLKGTINAEGKFVLNETDARGAKTGEFKGVWKTDEDGGASLEGEWINPKTKENWGFFATEEIVEFTGSAKITSKIISEVNKPRMFEITAEYPELSGVSPAIAANFNKLVKDKVMKEVAGFKKEMMSLTAEDLKFAKERGTNNYLEVNYTVELANDKVISIGFGNSTFEGGAHPNYYSSSINFDLQTGREIKLADLFKPGTNYLKIISDYSINDIKKKIGEMSDDEWIKEGAAPKAENYDSWNIKKTGILINFDPYQVAAYAAGPQDVLIPYSELKNILRNENISKM